MARLKQGRPNPGLSYPQRTSFKGRASGTTDTLPVLGYCSNNWTTGTKLVLAA